MVIVILTITLSSCAVVDLLLTQDGMVRSNVDRDYDISYSISVVMDEHYISTPLPDSITFTVINNSSEKYIYSPFMTIDKKIGDRWHTIPCHGGIPLIVTPIEAYSSVGSRVHITHFHAHMPPGFYRLILRVALANEIPYRWREVAIGEFIVREANSD